MRAKRRAYSLKNWKVSTPEKVVSVFWKITHIHRDSLDQVLDMGAGDGRFARGGKYKKYVGVEIDKEIYPHWIPTSRRILYHGCVFKHNGNDYSACIGNPPYLRHNDISIPWRNRMSARFSDELSLDLDTRSNLYLYFISLGLLKTPPQGLVSVLVPYEWAYIPSAGPIREYLSKRRWNVYIYRFTHPVFVGVQTTVSVSVIDKSKSDGCWKYFDVNNDGDVSEVSSLTDNGRPVLAYQDRGRIWGMRGLSPGKKTIFTLTENERIANRLTKKDVRPCVTSLRGLSKSLKILNDSNFNRHFILKNKKCWLIRSDKQLTDSLKDYVQTIPVEVRNTWTCLRQKPWYKYKSHPVPKMLMSSAFKRSGPSILANEVRAVAVGSVIGIHTHAGGHLNALLNELRRFDFTSRVISRDNGLKKIAVKQVNAALNQILSRDHGCK